MNMHGMTFCQGWIGISYNNSPQVLSHSVGHECLARQYVLPWRNQHKAPMRQHLWEQMACLFSFRHQGSKSTAHLFLSCRGTVSCQISSSAWWDQLQTQLFTLHCSFLKTYAVEFKTIGWKWWGKPKQTTACVTKSEMLISGPWGLNPCLWITRDLNTDPISGQQGNRMCMGGPARPIWGQV